MIQRERRGECVDNPWIVHIQPTVSRPRARSESHQRSWWIVHFQPTISRPASPFRIPPTHLVDRSFPAYNQSASEPVPNPTNAVGGSFIPSLHIGCHARPESHQRSWWIVHTQPAAAALRKAFNSAVVNSPQVPTYAEGCQS
jgi:hypothetical protein